MKVLFWNIGESINGRKESVITSLLKERDFDVVCFAEGTRGKANCKALVDLISSIGYLTYYAPDFVENEKLNLGYGYQKNGLKVFYKSGITLKETFSFSLQRSKGRIIIMRLAVNFVDFQLIFLHNYAKKGTRDTNPDQYRFMGQLSDMFEQGQIDANFPQTCILGDFNLEPWDPIMRERKYLETCFMLRQDRINQRRKRLKDIYYNPLLDTVYSSKVENLCGTYYSDTSGWALFDYPIYSAEKMEIDFHVITELDSGEQILNHDLSKTKGFINYGFDHLPITLKIN